MAKRLDTDLGCNSYDTLINDTNPKVDVVTVTLTQGKGLLKRGTVITGAPGGPMAAAEAKLVATNAVYILADDTDTTDAEAAVPAAAYRLGHFNRDALIWGGSYKLTDADEEIMRNAGIILSDSIEI